MMHKTVIVFLLGLIFTPTVFAEVYLLEFSGEHILDGQNQVVNYSGQMTFDTNVDTESLGSNIADYPEFLVGFQIDIGGVMFDQIYTPAIVSVINDDAVFGDFFGVGMGLTNDTGNTGFIGVQFRDMTQTVFSNNDFPTMIDLLNFGAFDSTDTSSTGVVFNNSMLSGGPFFGALSSATFTAVPLPAGLWLFISAGILLLRKSRA